MFILASIYPAAVEEPPGLVVHGVWILVLAASTFIAYRHGAEWWERRIP